MSRQDNRGNFYDVTGRGINEQARILLLPVSVDSN